MEKAKKPNVVGEFLIMRRARCRTDIVLPAISPGTWRDAISFHAVASTTDQQTPCDREQPLEAPQLGCFNGPASAEHPRSKFDPVRQRTEECCALDSIDQPVIDR